MSVSFENLITKHWSHTYKVQCHVLVQRKTAQEKLHNDAFQLSAMQMEKGKCSKWAFGIRQCEAPESGWRPFPHAKRQQLPNTSLFFSAFDRFAKINTFHDTTLPGSIQLMMQRGNYYPIHPFFSIWSALPGSMLFSWCNEATTIQ